MINGIVFVVILLIAPITWSAGAADVVGQAYTFDGKKLLYQEQHFYSQDGQHHEVLYLSIGGEKFAHKKINYSSGKFTPTFRQEDTRYPEIIDVNWSGENLLISYFSENQGEMQKKTIKKKTPMVVDAGFDHFIRGNWDLLIKGDRLSFYFLAPSRMTLVTLVVKSQSCSYPTQSDQCFYVNSSNWLVSLLLDPIELGYDSVTQKLKRFRGLANIHDEYGKELKVDIHFKYAQICNNSEGIRCDQSSFLAPAK